MRQQALGALSNHNYRLYVAGQVISQSGSWMQRIAQSWLVLDLTNSSVALGTLTAMQFLPILFLSLFAGVIVDRFPKRKIVIALQSAALLQAALLAFLTLSGTIVLWQLYVLAMALGAITSFENPARQTFVSEMVGRDHLQSAVSLNNVIFNAGRIGGPALGGVIIAVGGVGWCFALNALSYVAVLIALLLMRPALLQTAPPRPRAAIGKELLDGLRYARGERRISTTLLTQAFAGAFGFNFSVFFPLLARYAFDVGPLGFGALNAAQGTGAIVGSMLAAGAPRPRLTTLARATALFGLVLGALAIAPAFPIAVILVLALGGSAVFYSSLANTLLQLSARDEYRGRVMSLNHLLSAGTSPIGGPFTGALADALGVRWAIMADGALVLTGAAATWILNRRARGER